MTFRAAVPRHGAAALLPAPVWTRTPTPLTRHRWQARTSGRWLAFDGFCRDLDGPRARRVDEWTVPTIHAVGSAPGRRQCPLRPWSRTCDFVHVWDHGPRRILWVSIPSLGPQPVSNLDPTYHTPPKTKHTCELITVAQVQAGELHALKHLDVAWGNGVRRRRKGEEK